MRTRAYPNTPSISRQLDICYGIALGLVFAVLCCLVNLFGA